MKKILEHLSRLWFAIFIVLCLLILSIRFAIGQTVEIRDAKRFMEVDQNQKATTVLNKAIETYPSVPEVFQEYCTAFVLLSSRRTVGIGPNPITLTDIKSYIDLYGVPNYGVSAFVEMISKMDAEYISLTTKK